LDDVLPEKISCAYDYYVYLKDRYLNALPITSVQSWHDEKNSNFIDITIEKIGHVYDNELSHPWKTIPKAGKKYTRQYSAQKFKSYADMFQFDNFSTRKLILIEGNAGTGKTTLSHRVCKEWASKNILTEYTHVVLIHLRDQGPDQVASLEDLFADTGVDKYFTFKKLAKDHKNTVLFWLDGWNEIHDTYKKNSAFTRLLDGKSFPCATIVVTTRPSASASLKGYTFTHKYKLKGFSEPQIKKFVDDYLSRQECDEKSPQLFMQKLKSVHGLEQLAEVPLNLSILLKLFLDMRFKFPNTLTEIYYNILLLVLQYHKEKTESFNENSEIKPISDLDELPPRMLEMLHGLENQAFDWFSNTNLISKEYMLQYFNLPSKQLQKFNGMGLLEIKIETRITGEFKFYQYRYKAFQEFLAALYLTRLQKSMETEELKRIFGDMSYEMVWVFYAGISKLKRVNIQDLFPKLNIPLQCTVPTDPTNAHKRLVESWRQCYAYFISMMEYKENHMEFLLTLILCCYEAENIKACNLVADYYYASDIGHIEIPQNHAIPYFLLAISYFINHSDKKWSLRCDSIIPSGIEFLIKYSSPVSHTSGLWVLSYVVTSTEVDTFIELMKIQPSLQWIQLLSGSHLGDDGVEQLCNFLVSDECKIIKIELEHCGIGNAGLKPITNLLKNNSKLLCINLKKNCFSSENIKNLLLSIKQNSSLEYLILDEHISKDVEIVCILETINNTRREIRAKPLFLEQDIFDE